MANENFEKKFYSKVLCSINRNDPDGFYQEMNNAIRSGKLEIFQKRSFEQLTFDSTWISVIKDYLRYVENIVRNPRLYMQAVEEVTAMHRAKKINSRSIQHLSSHVQNVQDIREDGTIVPSKVLSTTYEDTLNIYENRFVMTLISKLAAFVEVRYESVINSIKSYQTDKFAVKSTFRWRNYDVDATINLNVKEEIVDEVSKKNQELLEDIITIRNYTRGFMNSAFYREMREKTRPITPPILRTNIITKSVDYNSCLKLWQFLDSYRQLGVELNIMDKELTFDTPFIEEVCDMIILDYSLVACNQKDRSDDYELLPYEMRTRRFPKYNPLLVASDEDDKSLDESKINEPSISEYFFQRSKKNYKSEFTQMVKSGITYNKAFVNTYRKMLKIENMIQEEIIEDMESKITDDMTRGERRRARFKNLKQEKRIYQSLIYAKKQDLAKAEAKLASIEKHLENFDKEQKKYEEELKKKRQEQLLEYRYRKRIEDGELTEEEAKKLFEKELKRKNRKPRKKKEPTPIEEVEKTPVEEAPKKSQHDILMERLAKARNAQRGKEYSVNTPKEENTSDDEILEASPIEEHTTEEKKEEVKPSEKDIRRSILMERLAKAKNSKHGREVKLSPNKNEKKELPKEEQIPLKDEEKPKPDPKRMELLARLAKAKRAEHGKEVKINSKKD